ncbi:NAD(P)-dependent oxidoreductase [Gammaproteobacteria bacterium]|nr:NAD(P)-dependent oxidoreductase [Gammaproteobacteria bacterium]
MKIVVTGGAGYVGNLLSQALLNDGHEVTIVDNFLYGYESILNFISHPKIKIVKTDIRLNERSYLKGQDVVCHLAGLSGYPACESNPNSAQLINVEATREIVNQLAPEQLLIFASSTSLYENTGIVCTEDMDLNPQGGLYGITKREGEKICLERENSISLRWATVFGVSARMRSGLILNDFVQKAIQDRALVVFSGHSKRTFMHVTDSVRGYQFALKNADKMRGQIFNMGSARLNYSKLNLANMIREQVEYDIIESSLADSDIRDFVISFDKAKALGFDCEISIEDGVNELIKLYSFYDPHSFVKPI